MKSKKSLLLTTLLLVFTLALSCVFFTACDPTEETETYAITWEVPQDTTVQVEGQETLPAEWGGELVFTVTPPTGYVSTVKNGNSTVTAKEGKYTVNVKKDTTIKVTNERKVKSIEVTKVEGAEFVYFAGDELDKSTITVTVNYEVGESETVTDYTVNPAMFAIGDESFTVTYKGVTSEAVALDKAAEGREFGFTKVDIELGEDGKPYYVLYGTYSNYDVENFKSIGFDFQEQGFYSEAQGGAQGWAYVTYNTTIKDEDFANGVYVLRVDMSALADNLVTTELTSMLFNPHMGFNTPGDNANPNVDTENYEEGKSVEVNGITYTLHRQLGEDDQINTTWGMVGVLVANVNAPSYKNSNVSLAKEGDKVFAVINGTSKNYTVEELTEKLTSNIVADYMYHASVDSANSGETVNLYYTATEENAQTIFVTVNEDGTYQVKLDITAATAGTMFFHFSFTGTAEDGTMDGKNFKCALTEEADKLTVEANGMKFTLLLTESTESWASGLVGVKVEAIA